MGRLGAVIARSVRAERARGHLSQADLAKRLGVSPQTVSAIELGRHRIGVDDLLDLCRALSVTQAKLMEGADQDDLSTLGL